jgi:hypothetical protein
MKCRLRRRFNHWPGGAMSVGWGEGMAGVLPPACNLGRKQAAARLFRALVSHTTTTFKRTCDVRTMMHWHVSCYNDLRHLHQQFVIFCSLICDLRRQGNIQWRRERTCVSIFFPSQHVDFSSHMTNSN